jgi:hypothetical protein
MREARLRTQRRTRAPTLPGKGCHGDGGGGPPVASLRFATANRLGTPHVSKRRRIWSSSK